jgi:hypothetical protein
MPDCILSFQAATRICIMTLQNPDAGPEAIKIAEEELMRYAAELDRLSANSGSAFDTADTPTEES